MGESSPAASSSVVYGFGEQLAFSHSVSDLPFWEACYRASFPNFKCMVDHRENGDHQKQGIDRSVILANSKQILIDEKARGRNKKTGVVYDDIALEEYSDERRRVNGWIRKPLMCDYIAYAIVPRGVCYLLPTLQLQAAWIRHESEWKSRFKRPIRAQNKGYTTLSWGIPVDVLFPAIGGCLRHSFAPIEFSE